MHPVIKIKRLGRNGRRPALPRYQTEQAAAMDLCAFLDEPLTLRPGGRVGVPTGLAVEPPPGHCALVLARSGLAAKRGVTLANGVGLIDPDYRGEIRVWLYHGGEEPFVIADGDRIAQLLLIPFAQCRVEPCDALSQTARGQGGFGSTGLR